MAIAAGQYKAKGIKGSAQLGETENGYLQIAIDLDVKGADGASLGSMTTFLFFTDKAAVYSWERLGLLGWKGKGPDDVNAAMDGIDTNEVDVRVTAAEQYKAADGAMKMGSSKIEIITGGGSVKLAKPLDEGTFKARLRALGGAPSSSAPSTANDNKPPF